MVRGVHEHLMFGEGTMDFPTIVAALREVGYAGGLHVELSRHSHMAVEAVDRAARFLRPLLAT
jgi:sugar phosphate isomerase/epimerase